MTSTIARTEEGTILKQDRLGGVRTPDARREALLDEFEKCGLSGAAFCRMAGIGYGTFATWVQKRRKKRAEAGEAEQGVVSFGPGQSQGPVRLFEAVIDGNCGQGNSAAGLAIDLPGGCRMRVESPMQVALAAELLGLMAKSGRR